MHDLIHSFDNKIIAAICAWPAWLEQPMLAITNVGQPVTVILFMVGLAVWSLWQGKTQLVVASIIVLATIIICAVLKLVLRRARPVNEYVQKMILHTYSFPSEHAAAATVGFGFIAYLVIIHMPQPWDILLALALVVFAGFIGVSRIYLGAHYPSDIVGGIIVGLVGLIPAILVLS